jgi:hypothetical protein
MTHGNGCCDIAISSLSDAQDIRQWSIHLYKEDPTPFPPTFQHPNTNLMVTIYQAMGAPFSVYPLVTAYQAIGTPGNFNVHIIPHHDAFNDPNASDRIAITYGLSDMVLGFAELGVAATQVDNNDERYSNQWWVMDALTNLYDQHFFSEAVFDETLGILLQLKQGVDPEDLILHDLQNEYNEDEWDEDDSDDDVPEIQL